MCLSTFNSLDHWRSTVKETLLKWQWGSKPRCASGCKHWALTSSLHESKSWNTGGTNVSPALVITWRKWVCLLFHVLLDVYVKVVNKSIKHTFRPYQTLFVHKIHNAAAAYSLKIRKHLRILTSRTPVYWKANGMVTVYEVNNHFMNLFSSQYNETYITFLIPITW